MPDSSAVERLEDLSVEALKSLLDVVRATGAPMSLLYAHINWANLQGVPSAPIGAPAPEVARETLTRRAQRRKRQRQLDQRRAEFDRLTRAFRAA